MATFIAATVPIWEYSDDPRVLPVPLRNPLRNGVFRDGGKQLLFLDGTPPKMRLAIQSDDVCCVIEMLQHPHRALLIRNRVLRAHARRLVQRSHNAVVTATKVRTAAKQLLDRAGALGPLKPESLI